jgi:chorismate mutase
LKPRKPMPPEVEEWRVRIDAIDERILELLNERSACAVEIGRIKRDAGLPIYIPEREQEILTRLAERNPGPLDALAVRRVFERVIDESRRLERIRAESEAPGGDGAPPGEEQE